MGRNIKHLGDMFHEIHWGLPLEADVVSGKNKKMNVIIRVSSPSQLEKGSFHIEHLAGVLNFSCQCATRSNVVVFKELQPSEVQARAVVGLP